jgi:hypothetical protein
MTDAGDRLSTLAGKPGVSPDHLALESRLLTWRESLRAEIRTDYPASPPDARTLLTAIESGTVVSREILDPLPDASLLTSTSSSFAAVIADALPASRELVAWLSPEDSSPEADRVRAEAQATWFLAASHGNEAALNELAADTGIEADLLEWAGRQFARPFFHRLGELLAQQWPEDLEKKAHAGCPCCGGAPRLARYAREESRRYLWCDLCDLQWPFPRVTCPFCLNRDHERLGYLTVEGTATVRIDVCEECKGYLRAIDEREKAESHRSDLPLEDVATFHLGLVAEKEGYRPGRLKREDDSPA